MTTREGPRAQAGAPHTMSDGPPSVAAAADLVLISQTELLRLQRCAEAIDRFVTLPPPPDALPSEYLIGHSERLLRATPRWTAMCMAEGIGGCRHLISFDHRPRSAEMVCAKHRRAET